MQRVFLPPATTIRDVSAAGEAAFGPAVPLVTPGRRELGGAPASRGHLEAPHPALERRRPLFHPARGWFRRTERAVSHFLARNLYPWVPGLSLPYSALLDGNLTLSEARIELSGLPRAFDGLRVLLITDIHAGPFISPDALKGAVDRLQRVEPDLILLGGDLATARVEEIRENAAAFRSLRAPCGVFAVLGNHDHYTGESERLISLVEGMGIGVLNNRSIDLRRDGQRLSLTGVDDLLMGSPDLERALHGTEPPVVLLSHNPDLLFDAARHGVALMLSGHTHAGQIRLRGLPVLVRQSRYRLDEGRYRYRETELVVSRGLGAVGVPWRSNCAPEAVLLTLDAA
jgi:predicted MPP superfamily phosphohydrolase